MQTYHVVQADTSYSKTCVSSLEHLIRRIIMYHYLQKGVNRGPKIPFKSLHVIFTSYPHPSILFSIFIYFHGPRRALFILQEGYILRFYLFLISHCISLS